MQPTEASPFAFGGTTTDTEATRCGIEAATSEAESEAGWQGTGDGVVGDDGTRCEGRVPAILLEAEGLDVTTNADELAGNAREDNSRVSLAGGRHDFGVGIGDFETEVTMRGGTEGLEMAVGMAGMAAGTAGISDRVVS